MSGSPSRAGDLVAGAGPPLQVAGVGEEQHRAHDVVGERLGVAVGVVGHRSRDAVGGGRVGDERDRVDVGAERRAGQREPAGRRLERLADALTPRQRVAGVVHLVEDHQRLEALGAHPHRERVDRDAGIGDRDPEVVAGDLALAGGVRRVDRDPGPGRGLGPLPLQVLGRRDDGDPVDDPAADQLGGHRQRERRLAGAGRRDGEEVAGLATQVVGDGGGLPGAQGRGRPPGRAVRPGRGEIHSSPSPGSPGLSDSQISWHSGHTGNFSGARLGTHTLPQSATTGVPITMASVSLSFST